MEQQKIDADTWKKKSHSAFKREAECVMPFYESLFRSASLHFKGFHKTLYPIFGIFSFIGSHLLTTQKCNKINEKIYKAPRSKYENQDVYGDDY